MYVSIIKLDSLKAKFRALKTDEHDVKTAMFVFLSGHSKNTAFASYKSAKRHEHEQHESFNFVFNMQF